MQNFESHNARIFFRSFGDITDTTKPLLVWAHGWGQNHASFLPIIQSLSTHANHITLDLPGFGQSPPPPENWGTEEYADAIVDWLVQDIKRPVIWVGHSFGCRVGIRLCAKHPDLISHLCLIAGAGLKRKRPAHKKLYFYLRIRLFKALKKFVPEGDFKAKLMAKFGSADYKNAGPMRAVFIRTVNEDLTETAKGITCPTTLIYGQNDTETPPEFGTRYNALIPKSTLHILNDQDHYTPLSSGRHQVIKLIATIIEQSKKP